MIIRKFVPVLALLSTVLLGAIPATTLAEVEVTTSGNNERTVAKQISATITAIDQKTREVTLQGPLGDTITLTASDAVARLNEFAVGDHVQATFVESINGELRAPTEEELKNPWVEVDAAGIADTDMPPGAAVGRAVKAVCTIEGMNRATRTVTVKDPRGNFHVIADVNPAKMEGVALGQTIVITYTRALALTLEKASN